MAMGIGLTLGKNASENVSSKQDPVYVHKSTYVDMVLHELVKLTEQTIQDAMVTERKTNFFSVCSVE